MTAQQLILALVLATMVFSVALELKIADFTRVAQAPKAVVCGLIPQFILLPVGTWVATLLLDLPPNVEVAMILVASCPGGSLSNVVTHFGRGNTALSVSVSAVAALLALVLTPFNFSWMVATNPATAAWLKTLSIDASDIWISLFALLAAPMALGLLMTHKHPAAAAKIQKPLANFSLLALLAFIVLG
ncbi:MAG: bile acid:sodium symporter family protein, partial [Comamonadaceae bacterium]